jgi:hypothetical protein
LPQQKLEDCGSEFISLSFDQPLSPDKGALRLATHTSSGEEEAHSKAGGSRMTSSLFLLLFPKLT